MSKMREDDAIWKAGKPRGKQQYKCKEYKKKFITEINYTKEFKQKSPRNILRRKQRLNSRSDNENK